VFKNQNKKNSIFLRKVWSVKQNENKFRLVPEQRLKTVNGMILIFLKTVGTIFHIPFNLKKKDRSRLFWAWNRWPKKC